MVSTNSKIFCVVYDSVKKADLSKGYCEPTRKSGTTMDF